MKVDDFLSKIGVKYEDLNSAEKQSLHEFYGAVEQNQLTVEKIKQYVQGMKAGVEEELCKVGLNKEQDTYLKARLRNYMLLEAFLTSPDRAKAALESALAGFKG